MRTHIDATASIAAVASPSVDRQGVAHRDETLSPIRVKHRIEAVDAARGCAMILVCLSHIKQHFEIVEPALYSALTISTRIATPTFLLLSGFVIGHLLRGNSRGRVGLSLVDRGLFLLLVAHLALGLAELRYIGFSEWVFGRVMITDVIGVALLIAVLVRSASTAALATAGAALCLLSWVIAMTLTVESDWARRLGSIFFHLHSAPSRFVDVALVPYLGLFLIGMALSSYLREALQEKQNMLLARRLGLIGALAVMTVLAAAACWHFGKDNLPDSWQEPHVMSLLRATLHPGSKAPPSPAYMLFYGGIGLLLTAAFFYNRPAWLLTNVADKAAAIGKASLLCFVVQDWLLFLVPELLGFAQATSVAFWFGYFALSVMLLYVLARGWERVNGNRFFTIGLKRLWRSQSALAIAEGGGCFPGTERDPKRKRRE